jgi:hypothetical protein
MLDEGYAYFGEDSSKAVWKIAEVSSTVPFWRQEAADQALFAPPGVLWSTDSDLVLIFQTVSELDFGHS